MQNIIRIMGKEGRTTIPLPIRESIGLARNDILEFAQMSDGHGLTIRILKICDNCIEQESDDEAHRAAAESSAGLSQQQVGGLRWI